MNGHPNNIFIDFKDFYEILTKGFQVDALICEWRAFDDPEAEAEWVADGHPDGYFHELLRVRGKFTTSTGVEAVKDIYFNDDRIDSRYSTVLSRGIGYIDEDIATVYAKGQEIDEIGNISGKIQVAYIIRPSASGNEDNSTS